MEWISVGNLLPGYDNSTGIYIVRCIHSEGDIFYLSAFYDCPDWIFFDDNYTENEPSENQNKVQVTHWLLPDKINGEDD